MRQISIKKKGANTQTDAKLWRIPYTTIHYTVRSESSRTPCPHGMMATCYNCGIKRPHKVHVGSWMERDCPFFIEDRGLRHGVVCNYMETEFKIYNSR